MFYFCFLHSSFQQVCPSLLLPVALSSAPESQGGALPSSFSVMWRGWAALEQEQGVERQGIKFLLRRTAHAVVPFWGWIQPCSEKQRGSGLHQVFQAKRWWRTFPHLRQQCVLWISVPSKHSWEKEDQVLGTKSSWGRSAYALFLSSYTEVTLLWTFYFVLMIQSFLLLFGVL